MGKNASVTAAIVSVRVKNKFLKNCNGYYTTRKNACVTAAYI